MKETENATFQLNEAKISESKRFDGFLAIATNAKQISVEQALDHYRHLFQIEHSFRTYKSHLKTINNESHHFYLRAVQNSTMELLSTFLGLRKLPNVFPQSEINNYL